MKLPRARNLIVGVGVAAVVVATGLLIAQDQETLRVRSPLAASDPRFPGYLSRLLGHLLSEGDSYLVHSNEKAFDAMLAAIAGARHRVSFETYIYKDRGDIPEKFTAAFEAAARRGVDVRLVFDAIGAKLDPAHVERLERAGCHIGWFNRVGSFSLEEVNYRTHRKALVVDGDIAFVGGIGIDDQWARDVDGQKRWRDMMVEVRGPAAINVEAAFNENWIETGGLVEPDLLSHDDEPNGTAQSIVVWSSSEGGTNALKLLYLLAIGSAQRTLDIESPYLLTDESTRWSLNEARRRGVRVRLLMEGDITDAKPVKFASRGHYEQFLADGISIYEYQPTLMHAKAMIVDGLISIIGSANFDNRSFELNDEMNAIVVDADVAAGLTRDFEADLLRSTRLDLDQWRSRPLHIRGRERMWSYFGELF
jgi:cardiolipin synthase